MQNTKLIISDNLSFATFPCIISFVNEIKEYAISKGVEVKLTDTQFVQLGDDESLQCNGYFSAGTSTPTLAVACDKPIVQWFKTFIHESCHMDQWVEDSPFWTGSKINSIIESMDLIDLWLSHKIELNDEQLTGYINSARDVELDCEKRVIEKIKKYRIPIVDIDEYIQQANAYIWFYSYVKKSRKWYTPGKEPYNNKKIVKAMPTMFLNSYDFPPEIELLFANEL